MNKKEIPLENLRINIYDAWMNKWFLLTAGNFKQGEFNTMTVAWGSLGCMWNKPFAQVVVRPTRHTYKFINKYESFTLCAFSEKEKKILQYFGSVSGRDENKISRSGLTPVAANKVETPVFKEAELTIECRKMYQDSMKPDKFLDKSINRHYPESDYHTIYFGEIVSASGVEKYIK